MLWTFLFEMGPWRLVSLLSGFELGDWRLCCEPFIWVWNGCMKTLLKVFYLGVKRVQEDCEVHLLCGYRICAAWWKKCERWWQAASMTMFVVDLPVQRESLSSKRETSTRRGKRGGHICRSVQCTFKRSQRTGLSYAVHWAASAVDHC